VLVKCGETRRVTVKQVSREIPVNTDRFTRFTLIECFLLSKEAQLNGLHDAYETPCTCSISQSSTDLSFALSTMLSEGARKPPAKAQRKGPGAFSWIIPALRSRRTLKTWFRCCVAFAATVVLMVARKPSDTMGRVSFFCLWVQVLQFSSQSGPISIWVSSNIGSWQLFYHQPTLSLFFQWLRPHCFLVSLPQIRTSLILEEWIFRNGVGMGMGKCCHGVGFVCEERVTVSSTRAEA
jgi:hypothetical protein